MMGPARNSVQGVVSRGVGERLRVAPIARGKVRARLHRMHQVIRDLYPLQRAANGIGVAHIAFTHLYLLAPRARRQPVCVPRQHPHAVAPLQQARR
jgi:hypothetical protein